MTTPFQELAIELRNLITFYGNSTDYQTFVAFQRQHHLFEYALAAAQIEFSAVAAMLKTQLNSGKLQTQEKDEILTHTLQTRIYFVKKQEVEFLRCHLAVEGILSTIHRQLSPKNAATFARLSWETPGEECPMFIGEGAQDIQQTTLKLFRWISQKMEKFLVAKLK